MQEKRNGEGRCQGGLRAIQKEFKEKAIMVKTEEMKIGGEKPRKN